MEKHPHSFAIGDSVRALRRPGFPEGSIVQLLDDGFVLVRWRGGLLETAHYGDLEHTNPSA
jgi:hypothetical protein